MHQNNVVELKHWSAWLQAEQRAAQAEHLAERQVLLRQNSAILDEFTARVQRPMSAVEAQTLLKATAGLDIPEGNALNLRPLTATSRRPPTAPRSAAVPARVYVSCGYAYTWRPTCVCIGLLGRRHMAPACMWSGGGRAPRCT